MASHDTLIATLGSEPQIVTIALDRLLAMEYRIRDVRVIHTAAPPVQQALAAVTAESDSGSYPGLELDAVSIEDHGKALDDFRTETDVAALVRTCYREVRRAKRDGRVVHLCVAGGRKVIAVAGMVVAQLLFGPKAYLDAYRRYLVKECKALDELCSETPRNPYALVEDLVLNAERRVTQRRYDDAVARIYRALEMIAQIRLRAGHGIDTSDVEPNRIPEEVRAELQRNGGPSGKVRIPLFRAWQVLEALRDDRLADWFARNRGSILNWLGTRNASILAHGLKPIDPCRYEMGARLCREALDCVGSTRQWQLPTDLPGLSTDSMADTG